MCNRRDMFKRFEPLEHPIEVTLGDGHGLKAIGKGDVMVKSRVKNSKTYRCNLHDVLLVPDLAYNLISVAAIAKAGKQTEFFETGCKVMDAEKGVVATGSRVGSLYYLDVKNPSQQVNLVHSQSKEKIWHRRFGHLASRSMDWQEARC